MIFIISHSVPPHRTNLLYGGFPVVRKSIVGIENFIKMSRPRMDFYQRKILSTVGPPYPQDTF